MKSIYETLAALGTGAVLMTTGCGSAPVNAKEVPAASDSKPSSDAISPPTESKSGDAATAGATTDAAKDPSKMASPAPADPSAAPVAASPSATPSAKPAAGAPKKVSKTKKPGGKKEGGQGDCGEGTCG